VNPPVTSSERITVTLIPRVAADLETIQDRTNMSKTDIVNRAITLYQFVDATLTAGAELIVRHDGKEEIIRLL
jgi:hypothetical protein